MSRCTVDTNTREGTHPQLLPLLLLLTELHLPLRRHRLHLLAHRVRQRRLSALDGHAAVEQAATPRVQQHVGILAAQLLRQGAGRAVRISAGGRRLGGWRLGACLLHQVCSRS